MTLTEAKKTITRLRGAGILATPELLARKPNGSPIWIAKEAGIAKGQTEPRQWHSPLK